jgi:putative endonuclease
MPFVVYVLKSETSDRLYIGQTQNLERRLDEHAAGQTRSTRGRGPWELAGTASFDTRTEAVQYERRLKRWKNPTRVLEHITAR